MFEDEKKAVVEKAVGFEVLVRGILATAKLYKYGDRRDLSYSEDAIDTLLKAVAPEDYKGRFDELMAEENRKQDE